MQPHTLMPCTGKDDPSRVEATRIDLHRRVPDDVAVFANRRSLIFSSSLATP
jgi:hypothetical protein